MVPTRSIGEIAKRIVAASRKHGGILSAKDLTNYRVRELEPVRSTAPSPSSGTTLAQLLNLIEPFPLQPADAGSAKAYHLIAEATRLAGADRSAFSGGPPQHNTPTEKLLNKDYARRRAALISPEHTLPPEAIKAGELPHQSPDTTHYSVVDAEGNAVSNTYTLSNNFGAAVIAPVPASCSTTRLATSPGVVPRTRPTHRHRVNAWRPPSLL